MASWLCPVMVRDPGPRKKSLFSSTLEIGDHGPKRATLVLVRQVPLFGSGELFGGEWMSNLPTCLREDSRSGSQIQKGVAFGRVERGREAEFNLEDCLFCFVSETGPQASKADCTQCIVDELQILRWLIGMSQHARQDVTF